MSGSCRNVYAIHQVARAMRQQIHIAIAARGTGRTNPKAGEEPENIRKIIRQAEQQSKGNRLNLRL
jgi:hypothetical protein